MIVEAVQHPEAIYTKCDAALFDLFDLIVVLSDKKGLTWTKDIFAISQRRKRKTA